jgi:hypothetical protein
MIGFRLHRACGERPRSFTGACLGSSVSRKRLLTRCSAHRREVVVAFWPTPAGLLPHLPELAVKAWILSPHRASDDGSGSISYLNLC